MIKAKPFIKWAGGKADLLQKIESCLPDCFQNENNITYVEPFLGGGAVLFHMLETHRDRLSKIIISDINEDLIACYRIIQSNPKPLIKQLEILQAQYDACQTRDQQGELYYEIRRLYNSHNVKGVKRAAQFIFLNHTCYNGLYRENNKGEFNVPCAYYKHPSIVNKEILEADHKALQGVTILCGDYQNVLEHIEQLPVFVYLDPPYRPLHEHANNFKKYNRMDFGDLEQERLQRFCNGLTERRYYMMQSNSDSRNTDDTSYFENIYYAYEVETVVAIRNINPYAETARKQTEVLIRNYRGDEIIHPRV